MKGAPGLREYEGYTMLERQVIVHLTEARIKRFNAERSGIDLDDD